MGSKLGISGLVNAFVEFTLKKIKRDSTATDTDNYSVAMNTDNYSVAMNTGSHSAAMNTGDKSAAMNTGYCGAAMNTGKSGFAISTGIEGKAKGSLGCYIAVAEWTYDESADEYKLVGFEAHKVDGETIKPDTFYSLKNGKFIAVK